MKVHKTKKGTFMLVFRRRYRWWYVNMIIVANINRFSFSWRIWVSYWKWRYLELWLKTHAGKMSCANFTSFAPANVVPPVRNLWKNSQNDENWDFLNENLVQMSFLVNCTGWKLFLTRYVKFATARKSWELRCNSI